jgi:AcrR family transcriptional regulator
MTRKYQLRRRAERQEETHRRIVDAAVELHSTLGPAHTTDLAVAERAGVARRTLYRHFPDEVSLFRACTRHGLEKWPPPDPEGWRQIGDPQRRLGIALRELYAYYRIAGAGLAVMWRDAPLLHPEVLALPSRGHVLSVMPSALMEGWRVRGRRRNVLATALAHATAVTTWQSLVQQGGLSDEEAVKLLIAMVMDAARGAGRGQRANVDAPQARRDSTGSSVRLP